MLNKIQDVRNAINAGCYQAALSLALSLPSICSAVEYGDSIKETNRYPQWCDTYLDLNDAKSIFPGFEDAELNGAICYALRCSFLHCGNDDIKQQPVFVRNNLKITSFKLAPHDSPFGYRYGYNATDVICEINIKYICELICDAAEKYYNNHPDKSKFTDHSCELI